VRLFGYFLGLPPLAPFLRDVGLSLPAPACPPCVLFWRDIPRPLRVVSQFYDSSTCGLALYSKNCFDSFVRFSRAFVSIPKDFLLCQTTRTIMASSDSSAKDIRLLDVRWPDNPDNPKGVLCHVARAIKNLHFDIQRRASSHRLNRRTQVAPHPRFASVLDRIPNC